MKISVCIATHNGEPYIFEQLQSILCQIGKNDEVVVSDDNSSDRTLDIIRSFNDNRILILGPNLFNSPIKNFEHGLKYCKGDIIFLSDQDDIWHKDKVKIMKEQLYNGYDLVLSDCKIINGKNEILEESFFKINGSNPGFFRNLLRNSYMGCCMAFTREVKKDVLPFPTDIPMHDVWIALNAELKFKVKFIKEPLLYYRQHDNNASDTATRISKYSFSKKIMFRFNLLISLLKRRTK